ncbi:hypothetical protein FH972_010165 [Carpinus fangiana]|uniref:Uncharacterized protein n=1 Tax=Carpinus fangiana TaxID=176857 RepID=A0A660KMF1_9ROSI|nr:hypothetical protein FH972_010165 [Carpinus fangiana]
MDAEEMISTLKAVLLDAEELQAAFFSLKAAEELTGCGEIIHSNFNKFLYGKREIMDAEELQA